MAEERKSRRNGWPSFLLPEGAMTIAQRFNVGNPMAKERKSRRDG
jgi:hypothetical protein